MEGLRGRRGHVEGPPTSWCPAAHCPRGGKAGAAPRAIADELGQPALASVAVPTVSALWGDRASSREEVADALSRFLVALLPLDARLSGWRPKGRTRKAAAAQAPLVVTADGLADYLRVQRTDFGGQLMPELGYSFSAWNGGPGGDAASVSCTAGLHAATAGLRNSVVLHLPDEVAQTQALDGIVDALRQCWDPDEVALSTSSRTVLWQRG